MTYDIYKFRASVDISGGFEESFEKMCSAIRNFVKGQTGVVLGKAAFDDGHIQQIVLPKRKIQAFHFPIETEQLDISVAGNGDGLLFGIRVTGEPLDSHPERELMARLFREGLFLQGVPLPTGLWRIDSSEALNTLYNLLQSPERTLPVIVISEFRRFPPPFPGIKGTVMVDDAGLATQVKGAAIVVRLPYDLAYQWTNIVGKEWSCFGGACRIYKPGLSFEEDDCLAHPLYMTDKIWWWRDETNRTGQAAFFDWLVAAQWRQNVFSKLSWKGLFFVPEASILQNELNADRQREAAEVGDTLRKHHNLAHQMQMIAAQATADRDAWFEEGEKQLKQIDHYKRLCQDLRNQNDALRYQLMRKDAGNTLLVPPIPDNYAEMGAWTQTYLAGRLILLGRARRELKMAAFEDVALVYRSLLLLAFEYRDMRMGRQDDSAFKQKLTEYGLECTGSIDPTRAGAEGDTYFVNYPQGSPQKEFLQFHLCKGTSRAHGTACGFTSSGTRMPKSWSSLAFQVTWTIN